MPYSLDRVGQSFVIFNPHGPRIDGSIKSEERSDELIRKQRIEKQRAMLEKKRNAKPIRRSNLPIFKTLRLARLPKKEQERIIAEVDAYNEKMGILIKSDLNVNPLTHIAKREREIMLVKKEREKLRKVRKELHREKKLRDVRDKPSYESVIVDRELYEKTVSSIDLSGLVKNNAKAVANGTVRIVAPDGIMQTFEDVFFTGREFQQSHGFVIVRSRLK